MRLLTLHEWVGPTSSASSASVVDRVCAMATNLPLARALARLRAYEDAYRVKYSHGGIAVEYHLLSVQTIPKLSRAALENGRIEMIEDLEING